jgi:hypothetical protein
MSVTSHLTIANRRALVEHIERHGVRTSLFGAIDQSSRVGMFFSGDPVGRSHPQGSIGGFDTGYRMLAEDETWTEKPRPAFGVDSSSCAKGSFLKRAMNVAKWR